MKIRLFVQSRSMDFQFIYIIINAFLSTLFIFPNGSCSAEYFHPWINIYVLHPWCVRLNLMLLTLSCFPCQVQKNAFWVTAVIVRFYCQPWISCNLKNLWIIFIIYFPHMLCISVNYWYEHRLVMAMSTANATSSCCRVQQASVQLAPCGIELIYPVIFRLF